MADIRAYPAENTNIKDAAIHMISQLSNQVTWDDIMYEIYVRQKIDDGLKAAQESRVVSHDDVKKRFGIK